jgi:hypothetical protein
LGWGGNTNVHTVEISGYFEPVTEREVRGGTAVGAARRRRKRACAVCLNSNSRIPRRSSIHAVGGAVASTTAARWRGGGTVASSRCSCFTHFMPCPFELNQQSHERYRGPIKQRVPYTSGSTSPSSKCMTRASSSATRHPAHEVTMPFSLEAIGECVVPPTGPEQHSIQRQRAGRRDRHSANSTGGFLVNGQHSQAEAARLASAISSLCELDRRIPRRSSTVNTLRHSSLFTHHSSSLCGL